MQRLGQKENHRLAERWIHSKIERKHMGVVGFFRLDRCWEGALSFWVGINPSVHGVSRCKVVCYTWSFWNPKWLAFQGALEPWSLGYSLGYLRWFRVRVLENPAFNYAYKSLGGLPKGSKGYMWSLGSYPKTWRLWRRRCGIFRHTPIKHELLL